MIEETIRNIRQKKGYSQEYMSFMLEISQNAYSKIERGRTELTVARLYDIAEILGVPVFELIPPTRPAYGLNWPAIQKLFSSIWRWAISK